MNKRALKWCVEEQSRQRLALDGDLHGYERRDFVLVGRSSALASDKVFQYVPRADKWDGESPIPGKLLTQHGVDVMVSMVRTELRREQRKNVDGQGLPNGRVGAKVTQTRLGAAALSSFRRWRHVVVTPLADEREIALVRPIALREQVLALRRKIVAQQTSACMAKFAAAHRFSFAASAARIVLAEGGAARSAP